jgi:hypothetical protein
MGGSIINFTKVTSGCLLKIRLKGSVVKTVLFLYFFEYSPDVLKKKTKVLNIFYTDKKCFMKIDIESSPSEIWIRLRFHNGSGSPSQVKTIIYFKSFEIVIDLKTIIIDNFLSKQNFMCGVGREQICFE